MFAEPILVKMLLLIVLTLLFNTVLGGVLQGQDARCSNEGAEVHVPFIAQDPCIRCFCLGGVVRCRRAECPSMEGCHMIVFNKPADSCCDVCQGCTENGISHKSNETWTDPENPCQMKSCQAGVITVSNPICPKLMCDNPVQLEGECCPSCQTCQVNGRQYEEGQIYQPYKDSCVTCHCKNGHSTCMKQACPVLNCPESKIVKNSGQCCPVCTGERKLFLVAQMCLFQGKMYTHGGTTSVNDCTSCTCLEGTMKCERNACPVLDCPVDHQVLAHENDCCPRCQNVASKTCIHEGVPHKHGAVWEYGCVECSCTNGQITCGKLECEAEQYCPLDTHELKFYPGQCCPVCEERYAMCTVFGDPHYATFDKKIYDFQGTCRYVLAKDCSENKQFAVYVRNFDRYNMPGSWTKSVRIQINDTKIGLYKSGKVKINKIEVSLPFTKVGLFTVRYENLKIVVESPQGLKIIWNTESYLEVHVAPKYKNKMCGMCGNYNDNSDDDFLGRDDVVHTSSSDFAQSWIHGSEKKSCNAGITQQEVQTKCQDNFSKWGRAHQECSILKSQSLADCRKVVDVSPYYRSCITDSCNCPRHRKCTCDAVTAYVRECERSGFFTDSPVKHSCTRQRRRIEQRVRKLRL